MRLAASLAASTPSRVPRASAVVPASATESKAPVRRPSLTRQSRIGLFDNADANCRSPSAASAVTSSGCPLSIVSYTPLAKLIIDCALLRDATLDRPRARSHSLGSSSISLYPLLVGFQSRIVRSPNRARIPAGQHRKYGNQTARLVLPTPLDPSTTFSARFTKAKLRRYATIDPSTPFFAFASMARCECRNADELAISVNSPIDLTSAKLVISSDSQLSVANLTLECPQVDLGE